MIKRIIALILTIFFICFKCLTWIPSAAATGIPAFDAFYYAILQTLGMAYTNGVEMDLAPAIAEIRENIPDYLQQPDNAVKYLLRDYASQLWDNSILQWSDSANENAAVSELSAIRLAGTEVSTPTIKDIVAQYQKKALDNDYDIVTPINTDAIAFWNKYDSLYINTYLNNINHVETDHEIPSPDHDYDSFLDIINGTGYSPYSSLGNGVSGVDVNWDKYGLNWDQVSIFGTDYNGLSTSGRNDGIYAAPITTIYINSSEGLYSCLVSFASASMFLGTSANRGYFNKAGSYNSRWSQYFSQEVASNVATWTHSFQGTLTDVFNGLARCCRNVNIYVDGILWALAGEEPIISNFGSTVPNAVIDNSTDDGKIVSNPIYWVVDNNTGLPIDSQINLDKLIDYLKGVIDGTNSDTSVDFGDLVDAGVIEKQDGTVISDTDIIAVPVADAIDDALADSDAIDTPVAAIGELPPLPPLPPFFPTPDFPEGDPTSGFHGMSVLARIINITNQSLPSEVVLVFYGVVFGAVILGLIKILHK